MLGGLNKRYDALSHIGLMFFVTKNYCEFPTSNLPNDVYKAHTFTTKLLQTKEELKIIRGYLKQRTKVLFINVSLFDSLWF